MKKMPFSKMILIPKYIYLQNISVFLTRKEGNFFKNKSRNLFEIETIKNKDIENYLRFSRF